MRSEMALKPEEGDKEVEDSSYLLQKGKMHGIRDCMFHVRNSKADITGMQSI